MNLYQFNTPILLLMFNRPNSTERVFTTIRQIQPKQLFISSDGPRNSKAGEKEIVENLQKKILDSIDWPCEVKTLFRKTNLGCKYAVSEAISWFFQQVEQGIILEDDCIPHISFFHYCQELLEIYKENEQIFSISGYNRQRQSKIQEDYFFSKYFSSWGWATWKRAWEVIDINLNKAQELLSKENSKNIFQT